MRTMLAFIAIFLLQLAAPVAAITEFVGFQIAASRQRPVVEQHHQQEQHHHRDSTLIALSELISLKSEPHDMSINYRNSIISFCSLHWVGCSEGGVVVAVELPREGLEGALPSSISWLWGLEVLDLSHNKLRGALPPAIFLSLKRLQTLDLSGNRLSGKIPPTLGSLRNLTHLDLSRNAFSGPLPRHLRRLSSLQYLSLASNSLQGSKPLHLLLARLPHLQSLSLAHNRFSGRFFTHHLIGKPLASLHLQDNLLAGHIPPSMGNCSSLMHLDLSNNILSGNIPRELLQITSLQSLNLAHNKFTGTLPQFNESSSFESISLSSNMISGPIPGSIGSLSNLRHVDLDNNVFTGSIPTALCNCSQLQSLSMSHNRLSSPIPSSLANCASLKEVRLDGNQLSGSIPSCLANLHHLQTLSLSGNSFHGKIPPSIGNCSQMIHLSMGSNNLNGPIPLELSHLQQLQHLSLFANKLQGNVPFELGNLTHLTALDLSNNGFTGELPWSISNLHGSLEFLLLSNNKLAGNIPCWIGELRSLVGLDLSYNSFTGNLPGGDSLKNMLAFRDGSLQLASEHQQNHVKESLLMMGRSELAEQIRGQSFILLAHNNLTGPLPLELGELSNLWVLQLKGNNIGGAIPSTLGNARALCYLDLSQNALEGGIPETFVHLSFLEYLNVSSNRLMGQIPQGGQLITFGETSYLPNPGLCGLPISRTCTNASSEPITQPCHGASLGPPKYTPGGLAGIIIITALATWTLLGIVLWWKSARRRDILSKVLAAHDVTRLGESPMFKEALSINVATFENLLPKVTLADLLRATENFHEKHVIGDGGSGTVYKAQLDDETVVAIKRVVLSDREREFWAEMETLGKVRHQNLVPLIGYCTCSTEKVLVYKYMPNGNLDLWLHSPRTRKLDWVTRLRIAQGAARGLAFLHHICIPHIVHRDIKSTNILLDEDFDACVADFGLARLISAYDTHLSTGFAGTVGYIAPEYGQTLLATTKGDVYSFGMVLLELLTGKRPTDRMFREMEDDGNLVSWVCQMVLHNRIGELLDPFIGNIQEEGLVGHGHLHSKEVVQMLGLAVWCTDDQPKRRPTMLQVSRLLDKIVGKKLAQQRHTALPND